MIGKHILRLFVTLLIIFISPSIIAQGEATMLFLRIPPSPLINGMGGAGTALPQ